MRDARCAPFPTLHRTLERFVAEEASTLNTPMQQTQENFAIEIGYYVVADNIAITPADVLDYRRAAPVKAIASRLLMLEAEAGKA